MTSLATNIAEKPEIPGGTCEVEKVEVKQNVMSDSGTDLSFSHSQNMYFGTR